MSITDPTKTTKPQVTLEGDRVILTHSGDEYAESAEAVQSEPKVASSSFFRYSVLFKLVLLVVAAGAWVVLPSVNATFSYFNDTEGSKAGLFVARELDLEVDYDMQQCQLIDEGGRAWFQASIESGENSLPTLVDAYAEQVEGSNPAFCDALYLRAKRDGEQVYWGTLLDFSLSNQMTGGEWFFEIKYPEDPNDSIPGGATCNVDLVFDGFCADQTLFDGGYIDEERIPIRLTKGRPCLNCGGGGDVTIIVENNSSSTVTNTVNNSSNTGGNSASGGNGGDGGNSGNSGDGANSGDTGNAGNGGDGGAGGTITTGNASSTVVIENTVNTSSTTIEVNSSCGCGDCSSCGCGECSSPCSTCGSAPDTTQSTSTGSTETTHTSDDEEALEETNQAIDDIQSRIDERLAELRDGTRAGRSGRD